MRLGPCFAGGVYDLPENTAPLDRVQAVAPSLMRQPPVARSSHFTGLDERAASFPSRRQTSEVN